MLPAVVFLLVVMALLGGVLMRLAGGGSASVAFETTSTRAYLSAYSGIEWGSAQLVADGDCDAVEGTVLNLSSEPGMRGCSTNLTCSGQLVDNAAFTVFTLTSVGNCGAGDLSAERILGASLYLGGGS